MSTPSFSVTKSSGIFVQPSGLTPSDSLRLSPSDNNFFPGSFVVQIIVFHHGGRNAANIVKHALGKVLVPYYPMAGRLTRLENGELVVAFPGDGVWFVEASADYDLPEDVSNIPGAELISYPPNPAGCLLMVQVTKFTCGGSLMGLVYDHCVVDGGGFAQFISAVAAVATGAVPIIEPIWCREAFPGPPKSSSPPPPPPPPRPPEANLYYHIDIPSSQISKLKAQFQEKTGQHCSTFDVLTAVTWQSRARAMDLEPDADVGLGFVASFRHLITHALPADGAGYYGNCVYPLSVTVAHQKLVAASLVEAVQLIRDAKARLPDQVSNWLKGEKIPKPGNNWVFLGNWLRLGFEEMDFGWGKPHYVAPVIDHITSPMVFFVSPPTPKEGVRVITKCVVEGNLATFQEEMVKAFDVCN